MPSVSMDMTGSITHSEHRKSRRRNRKKKMARKGSMDDSSKKSYDSQMSELTGDGDSDSLKSDTLESSTRVVKERDNEKSEEKKEEALQSSSVEFEFPLFKKNEGGVSDSSSNKGNKDDSASSSQDVKETSTRNPKAKVWADLVNKCEDAERENKSTPERETEEKEKIAQVIHKIPKNLLSQAFEELVRHSENLKGSPTKDESRSKLKEEQHPEQKSEHELAETSEKEPDPIREDGPKSFWTGRTIALVALVFAIVLGFLLAFDVFQKGSKSKNSSGSSADAVCINCVDCPSVGEESLTVEIQPGEALKLGKSQQGTLCTLFEISGQKMIKPIGRSYNHHDWEQYSGHFSNILFSCDEEEPACFVNLPKPEEGYNYILTSYDHSLPEKDVAARFLEKTTFGPRRSEIASFTSPLEWIQKQMSLPATSHRAFFRERATNWHFEATHAGLLHTGPCNKGARFRRFAFANPDKARIVTVSNVTNDGSKRIVSIDGEIRTIARSVQIGVHSFPMDELPGGDYQICGSPGEQLGGDLRFFVDKVCVTQMWFDGAPGNPPVVFNDQIKPGDDLFLDLDSITQPVMSQFFGGSTEVLELTQDLTTAAWKCNKVQKHIVGAPDRTIVGTTGFSGQREYWIHTPSFQLLSNELHSPMLDGGKSAVELTANAGPRFRTSCSNAPRSFLNEDFCVLSMDACNDKSTSSEDVFIEISIENLKLINTLTSEISDPRFAYAVTDLRQSLEYDEPPCKPGAHSRWVPVDDCTGGTQVDAATKQVFADLITNTADKHNKNLRDVFFPQTARSCNSYDANAFDFKVQVGSTCWQNTHVDNWRVFDFSYWAVYHPGNSNARNPIKEFAELHKTFILKFPSWHGMDRWHQNKQFFPYVGRLGDITTLEDLPHNLYNDEIASAFGRDTSIATVGPTVVCGSPFEVASIHSPESGTYLRGGFDMVTRYNQTLNDPEFQEQRQTIWMEIALKSKDQLRQRVAWALSQIIVVSPGSIQSARNSEIFLAYYDIFVRNAFGNYFDILKEVTYSPMMAEMLSYLDGQSTGFAYIKEFRLQYADENFAREIMQLFSIGLNMLNSDGTLKLDDSGNPILTYTNEDITEYAKVYTGYNLQKSRGNVEDRTNPDWRDNQIDPAQINIVHRDHLPKLGLNKKYIGDGYPLCSDLPKQHFLKQGATYRLLASNPNPELQHDPLNWSSNLPPNRISLGPSPLADKICSRISDHKDAPCEYPAKVVLDEDLPCTGVECDWSDIRTVQLAAGIWYEYVRVPCVHRAFYIDGQAMRLPWEKWFCGDPSVAAASTACCELGNKNIFAGRIELYSGERVSYEESVDRCAEAGARLCPNPWKMDCWNPELGPCDNTGVYYWTTTRCDMSVKVNTDGSVAIMHEVPERTGILEMVASTTKMFFRVDWISSKEDVGALLTDYVNNCREMRCFIASDGVCQCEVFSVTETAAFDDASLGMASTEEILSTATIGAFPPTVNGEEVIPGVWKYPTSHLSSSTVFEIVDANGITHYRKNVRSVVSIGPYGDLSFRNPVHFISLSDPTVRDAMYETDAALEHYFYHPNTAPFLAIRFAQRFGISNPSPRYVEAISSAFRTGIFTDGSTSIGSGVYGDLQATIAAVLLDRESQDVLLDADPMHGSLLEPYLKIVRLMRSLEFEATADSPLIRAGRDLQSAIGQEPHKYPSVFSFFKPEFQPAGKVSYAGLVSPEMQVLNGFSSINLMNSMLSYIKYGMNLCYEGFGYGSDWDSDCAIGNSPFNDGKSTYSPGATFSVKDVVDDLATLLTSGRLSKESRLIIQQRYLDTFEYGKSQLEAIINVQQLIATSPEFHTNGLFRKTGKPRFQPADPTATGKPYKAVIYVMLPGGMDSFNMLAPHTCSGTNAAGKNLRDQYDEERGVLAFNGNQGERRLTIQASNQPCEEFAIHDELEIVKDLYDDGDLVFFANAGVINRHGMTKLNFNDLTKTQLFAHNKMQEELKKVDPFDLSLGTGVLGRAKDVLTRKGHVVNSLSIDESTIALEGTPSISIESVVVGRKGAKKFALRPRDENYFDIEKYALELNAESDEHSNIHADSWSKEFAAGMRDGSSIVDYLRFTQLTQSIWYTNGNQPKQNNAVQKEHWEKWSTLFKLLQTRKDRKADRDIFFTAFEGWDHHDRMKINLRDRFQGLNHGIKMFTNQLKVEGIWDQVTIVVVSDFGRTLTPNSNEGSDHAWSGHYFMMGGSVKGGQILGDYPDDITDDGPLNIGRGRIMPTLSWDAIWHGVIQWMGVEDQADLDICLPNAANTVASTSSLFSRNDLFYEDSMARHLRGPRK